MHRIRRLSFKAQFLIAILFIAILSIVFYERASSTLPRPFSHHGGNLENDEVTVRRLLEKALNEVEAHKIMTKKLLAEKDDLEYRLENAKQKLLSPSPLPSLSQSVNSP